jgi:hypothetical protein
MDLYRGIIEYQVRFVNGLCLLTGHLQPLYVKKRWDREEYYTKLE